MAITAPIAGQPVSVENWGKPVTDEINRMTPLVVAATAWANATLANGWTNYGGGAQVLQYRKIGDIVYLRGSLKSPGGGAPVTITTLPAGFRPPADLEFPCTYYNVSRLVCGVIPQADGQVVARDVTPVNAMLSLTVITFSTLP